jgi:hypothetical protein
MPDANARVSVALTAQVRDDGPFPSCQTYPASFERYLTNGTTGQTVSKVYATTGTVGSTPTTLPVASTLSRVKLWYVENLAAAAATAAADVTVAGAPVNGTVARGQMVLATNDYTGWTAANVTITGTAGTAYKIIALGN